VSLDTLHDLTMEELRDVHKPETNPVEVLLKTAREVGMEADDGAAEDAESGDDSDPNRALITELVIDAPILPFAPVAEVMANTGR